MTHMKSEDPIAPESPAHSTIHRCYFCRTPIPKRPGRIQPPCPRCPEQVIHTELDHPWDAVNIQFQHRGASWELVTYPDKKITYVYANNQQIARLPFLLPDLSPSNVRDKVDFFLTLS
jgi:hypothetical protein